MKKIGILVAGTLLLMLSSCEKKVNCEVLSDALLQYDQEKAKTEINKLCADLKPHGNIGQKENLNTLVNRLQTQCGNMDVTLLCFACIETLPPQSEISVAMDSSSTTVCRIIDIFTPDDDILSFRNVHICLTYD